MVTNNSANIPTGASGTILRGGGVGSASAFSTATYPATTTINQILYSSAANVVGGITTADNGVLITGTTGVPSVLADGTTGQVLTATTGSPPSWANAAASSITITGDTGGGLTGNSFTLTGGSTGLTFAGSGTTETLGGTLDVANGGTGAATLSGPLLGNGTSAVSALSGNSKVVASNSSGTFAARAFSVVIQTFTSTGTYTPTSGMLYCQIQASGGGGAGGGGPAASATYSTGGGGGSGEYAVGVFSAATIGASQSVTIGAAGTGNSGTTGGNGGNTSVGALISANGGSGGPVGAAGAASQAAGGAGGTGGSGGSYRVNGSYGGSTIAIVASGINIGGNGASSPFGSGALYTFNANGAGATGNGAGGGGCGDGGGNVARTGGAGTKGAVIITEYVIA